MSSLNPALTVLLVGALLAANGTASTGAATVDHWTASQEQPPKFGANKAGDGQEGTNWAAADRPPVWTQGSFDRPQWISRVRLLQVPMAKIYSNARRVAVSFSDGTFYSCTLPDRAAEIAISLPRTRASWFRLTIESAYRQTYYVGLRELRVDDEGAAAAGRTECSVSPAAERASATTVALGSASSPRAVEQTTKDDQTLIARLAPRPVTSGGHPTLWMNAADVERAKDHIRKHAWARRAFAAILAGADRWLAMPDDQLRAIVPPGGGCFDNKAACPYCGGACVASLSKVRQVTCSKCGKTLPDPQHADDGRGWKDPKTGETNCFVALYNSFAVDRITDGAADLSHAYVLTGDERYAHVLSVLLDALAAIYPSCDKGPLWYPGEGGRLNRPFYQTARTLIYYAREYDLSYRSPAWDEPSCNPALPSRRANYERNLLRNGADYCFGVIRAQKAPALHNGNCDYLQGALAVGRVLDIDQFIRYDLESDLSIFNFIENTIDRDGQYYETSVSYSQWATDLFGHHAEMLRDYRSPQHPRGVNLYDHPKLKLNYLRSDLDMDCAGHAPGFGDAGPDLTVVDEQGGRAAADRVCDRLEVLAARTSDPDLRREALRRLSDSCGGDIERRRGESPQVRWLLFHAVDIPPPEPRDNRRDHAAGPASALMAGGRGIAILRSGSSAPAPCALLRYGATLNHGSPDEMNVNLYALGREITYDQGYGWAHHRAGWAHATVAHNLVVVNEKNQLLGADGSGGSLECYCQSSTLRVVAADDPAAYGGAGVRRYRRLLALAELGSGRSCILDIFDVAGGQRHDLSHHFAGSLAATPGVAWGPPQSSGSLAGPGYEWWKLVQPSGYIAGQKKGFYWNAPPENGYGFLFDVQHATSQTGAPAFIWKLGERRGDRPTNVFLPAHALAATSGVTRHESSGGAGVYRAEKPGGFVDLRIVAPAAGEYLVLARLLKSDSFGTLAATLDRRPLGQPLNTYSPVEYATDMVFLGRATLTEGLHELRLTCVGKDAQSDGYSFGLKDVALEGPQFFEDAAKVQTEGVALTVLPPADSRFVTAKAKGLATAPTSNYVLVRRAGENLTSRFISLIEPFVGQPLIQDLAAADAQDDARHVLVVRWGGDREDWFCDMPAADVAREVSVSRQGQRVDFCGGFAAVRTRADRPYEVLMSGAARLRFGEHLGLVAERAAYSGRVQSVDYEKGLVLVDAALPEGAGRGRPLVYFSRATYSRNAPYKVVGVQAETAGSRLNLGDASLVLARGRATADPAGDVLANGIPLDRERMFGHAARTRYFEGKAIRNLRSGAVGRIKNANLDASVVLESNPDLLKGDHFELLDIQPGDTWMIPAVVSLVRSDGDCWKVSTNVRLRVALGRAAGALVRPLDAASQTPVESQPAAGGVECLLDPAQATTWEIQLRR